MIFTPIRFTDLRFSRHTKNRFHSLLRHVPRAKVSILLIAVAGLCFAWLRAAHVYAAPHFVNPGAAVFHLLAQPPLLPTQYGAAARVGEVLEPCATPVTTAGALVLTTTNDWQSALQNAAPGTTLLLRAGVYQATQKLNINAGVAGSPVTVKPYNCEAVTLRGSFTPLSYTVIAGLRIEGVGLPVADLNYVIRVDGKNKGALRTLVVRNNTIVGGTVDAVRVNDDVVGLAFSGNNIDGGQGGHDLFVTTEVMPINPAKSPDNVQITNNRFTKVYFQGTRSEDMFQVRDARQVRFTYNSCENGARMEQCIDIKSITVPMVIQYNRFDGSTLHQNGPGEDNSAGCMTIHEFDGHPENHLIEYNYFRNCRDTVIRFASEGGAAKSSGTVRYNVFLNPDATDADGLLIWLAENVIFEHNTMIRGTLKLGRGDGLSKSPPITPKNTVLKNNLFYLTRLDDNTKAPTFVYTCSHNLFFTTTQRGNQALSCAQSQTADPLFTALANEDYRPLAGSPACGSGENGRDRGALACATGSNPTITPLPTVTNTPLPVPTNTPVVATNTPQPIATNTPTKTPLPPTPSTTGGISGKVINSQNVPMRYVNVSAYSQSGSSWKQTATIKTDAAGNYSLGNLLPRVYRVRFSITNYNVQYYNNKSTVTTAADIQVNAGQVKSGINAVLTQGATRAQTNLDATVTATDTLTLSTTNTTTDTTTDTTTNTTTTTDTTIGGISFVTTAGINGQVRDATTGDPVVDAMVTLYKVPGWRVRTGPDDTALDSCESLQSKAADIAWSQPAPPELGEWLSAEVDPTVAAAQINPIHNPQTTVADGRYAWQLMAGCWYVEVAADGYLTTVSSVIGSSETPVVLDVVLTRMPTIYLPIIQQAP